MTILQPDTERVTQNPLNQMMALVSANKGEIDAKISVIVDILDESIPGFAKSFKIKMTEASSVNLHTAYAQSQMQGNLGHANQLANIIESAKQQAIDLGCGNTNPKENPYLKAFWDGKARALTAMAESATEEV